ncbi:MAG: tRNA lysidine(34) synthetase TilS [Oscillospiraceae bacterium]|nr:tRNA lysidine(34) synthetase TilS [Oscillospiraceae bacterium]
MKSSLFLDKVRAAVSEHGMTENVRTVTVALSGGADSVALLRAMILLREELGFSVRACHLNHCLRGEESDADERFCAELCGRLGIPLDTARIDVNALRGKHESLEETARRLRYGFFREVMSSAEAPAVLATAHTASDNVETVMFNLTRGTGASGLCGIPPVRRSEGLVAVRPLIGCTRADVESFLDALGQEHITDRSNFSVEYSRNRIRMNVVPELEKINPALADVIGRMTRNLRGDNAYLEELADKALDGCRKGRGWDAAALSKLPEPIKARAVRKILMNGGIEPSALRIQTAAELLEKRSARYNPCKDRFFTIRKGVCFTEEIHQNFGGYNEKKSPKSGDK